MTIPVQALVHDSQLNIPGGHSKASAFTYHVIEPFIFVSLPFSGPRLGIDSGRTEPVASWLSCLNCFSRCVWGNMVPSITSYSWSRRQRLGLELPNRKPRVCQFLRCSSCGLLISPRKCRSKQPSISVRRTGGSLNIPSCFADPA